MIDYAWMGEWVGGWVYRFLWGENLTLQDCKGSSFFTTVQDKSCVRGRRSASQELPLQQAGPLMRPGKTHQPSRSVSPAALVDHIQFGDCHIGCMYNVSFTVTNHSQVNMIRFEWPLLATISFSPQVSKSLPCTLNSIRPKTARYDYQLVLVMSGTGEGAR